MKNFATIAAALALTAGMATGASASVVASNATEIAKPATVTNAAPGSDDGILWFQESVGSVVAADAEGLGSTGILEGQVIDSYMIFLNREVSSSSGPVTAFSSLFTFGTEILGVFGEANGSDLVATDYLGGTTTYTNFNARGIENGNSDSLSAGAGDDLLTLVGANELDVFFRVTQPGDWVRVAVVSESTLSAVPLPAGALLLPMALAGFAAVKRRAKKS